MTTEEDRFLETILLRPDDDAPRRMYADWLREGSGRDWELGEFIHTQLQLADLEQGKPQQATAEELERMDAAATASWLTEGVSPRRTYLKRREQELLFATNKLRRHPQLGERHNLFFWAGTAVDLIPQGAAYLDHATFERGFIARLDCDLDDFRKTAGAVFKQHPVVAVRLAGLRQEVQAEAEGTFTPDGAIQGALVMRKTWVLEPDGVVLRAGWSGVRYPGTMRFRSREDQDAWVSAEAVRYGRLMACQLCAVCYHNLRAPGASRCATCMELPP